MRKLILALIAAFLCFSFALVTEADDSPVVVTITKSTPIETFAANGDIVAVSESTVGAHFHLVSITGSQIVLQDAQGIHYRIDLTSTDYDPNKAVASTPPSSPPQGSPAAASENPFGTPVQPAKPAPSAPDGSTADNFVSK